ncbi:hypothetical protein A3860_20800 [Niastella vici]|uniref:Pectate lyase superfamily protein domain-containing protein n=1 Tax=Niastella vici TaxID=1703345 RepID=A0A1V9G1F7_9BACT|nr:hypothetical protein [Niastella vici]OQP64410.1 hypothetical protein A3860_20800 [Niastella vici]
MITRFRQHIVAAGIVMLVVGFQPPAGKWESKFLTVAPNGTVQYHPDEKGNILPDFSRVGYYQGDQPIPDVPVVKTISASEENSQATIQAAIDEVSHRTPDKNGFRGAILLKKGVYRIPGIISITTSGIILRGEGDGGQDTRLIATGNTQRSLITISGTGNIEETTGSRVAITDAYVPTGAASFHVESAAGFKKGDKIIVFRPGTDAWIKDLKMDVIDERDGTKQWRAKEYDLRYERVIIAIQGNTVFIDNPVVMSLDKQYGGGYIYKYSFNGRIEKVGIEQLRCESEYTSDTAEEHGWTAIQMNKMENGWVRNVTARYFGYACVHLDDLAKWITVTDSRCLDAKSKITGGRRYSFNNDGQQNLVMNCQTTEGRHDYVTGARVCGPNVFYNCSAKQTHADIGPHHRWSSGTLYDNIVTDGEINIQDRGNWGSGHGWAGVTQIVWNCTAKRAAVQSPWANGKNYCIGLKGGKYAGRLTGRPDGEWEGQNKEGLEPGSLYLAQLKARKQ